MYLVTMPRPKNTEFHVQPLPDGIKANRSQFSNTTSRSSRPSPTFKKRRWLVKLTSLLAWDAHQTPQITTNLAEMIVGRTLSKNWHRAFIIRHKKRLKSLYLRNIDHERQKAEYKPSFEHYFALVSAFSSVEQHANRFESS